MRASESWDSNRGTPCMITKHESCSSSLGRKKSHVSHIRMVRSCSEASNISTDSSAPKIKDCRLSESRNNCASAAIGTIHIRCPKRYLGFFGPPPTLLSFWIDNQLSSNWKYF